MNTSGDVETPGGAARRGTTEAAWAAACLILLAGAWWLGSCGKSEPAGGAAKQQKTTAPAAAPAPKPSEPVQPGPAATSPATVPAPGPVPDAAAEPPIPGWYAAFGARGAADESVARTYWPEASLALLDGETIIPGLPAAGLTASFTGQVAIDQPGRYRFGAEAQGAAVKVVVYDKAGKILGEAAADASPADPGAATQSATVCRTDYLQLPRGWVTVAMKADRAGAGAWRARAMWEMTRSSDGGFVPEPIPTTSVTVPEFGKKAASSSMAALHGRVLLGELNCLSCHSAGESRSIDAVVLRRQAPLLGEIGRRASAEWLGAWVSDPQKVKPGSGMPDVIGDSAKDKADADAIVHFLVSLGGPMEAEAAATEERVLEQGRRLYHTVGCVACHGALDSPAKVFGDPQMMPEVPKETPAQPFGALGGKWRPAALSEYLQDPLRVRPSGRMPSLNLNAAEADLIATYLVNRWAAGSSAPAQGGFKLDAAKVETGRAAFAARGCASCHEIGQSQAPVASTLQAKGLGALAAGKGCLSPADAAAPRYTLSDGDRESLAAGIAAVNRALASGSVQHAPIDALHRSIEAFGCRNCHERNGRGGPSDAIKIYFRTLDETELGDEGRLPPRITGEGWKLSTQWLRKVFTEAGRARPYMATRMPQFGSANVGHFPELLAEADGVFPDTDAPEPKPSDELAQAGRTLVGDKGMNCISCHTFGNLPPAGTAGPNIVDFGERIRYEWWKTYIMGPPRFKPGTRMTSFYASLDGLGQVKDVYGGDPDKQTDALWAYFNLARFAPPPDGLKAPGGTAMQVGGKPVVFRTFMKDAGSRGIAVGYPAGMHFGFDATAVRLVDAWKGEFIDTAGAWKGRGGMVAGGQGTVFWKAPEGPAIVVTTGDTRPDAAKAPARKFGGYTIDKDGVPTFDYRIESDSPAQVSERFEPARAGAEVRRWFRVSGVPEGATVWLNVGTGVASIGAEAIEGVDQVFGGGGKAGAWHGFKAKPGAKSVTFAVEIKP